MSPLNAVWYQRIWLPCAAAVYLIICLFDFVIMPIYVTEHNSRIESMVFKTLDGKDAATFADTLIKTNQSQRQWNPLTLLGAGMFHLAFGSLLAGAAVTRGLSKKSEVEGYYRSSRDMYRGDQYGSDYDNQPYSDQGRYNDIPRSRQRPPRRDTSIVDDGPQPHTD